MNDEKIPVRVWKVSMNEVELVVPSWRSTHVVKLPITQLPDQLRQSLKIGTRFLATGNINAMSEEDLNLADFELA